MSTFDPEDWALTFFRALKAYVESNLNTDLYDIRFSFPAANYLADRVPLRKTIISFEIDEVRDVPIGFGDQVVDADYDEIEGTIQEHEAQRKEINLDVGIFTGAPAGGTTARLRALGHIHDLFAGPDRYKDILENVGIEIESLTGGGFIIDSINDIDTYRVVDVSLQICLYSRRLKTAIEYIDGFELEPSLDVDGNTISG